MLLDKCIVLNILRETYQDNWPEDFNKLKKELEEAFFLTLSKVSEMEPYYVKNKWQKTPDNILCFRRFCIKLHNSLVEQKKTIESKFPKGSRILFRVVSGSQAYGTSTPTSDMDVKGVFLADTREMVLGNVPETLSISKDEFYYEFSYFINLLRNGDTMVMEMLFAPDKCHIEVDVLFKILIKERNIFLSKKLHYNLVGFAKKQVKKATNYNKKSTWDEERVRRKNPSEFCTFISNKPKISKPLLEYLHENNINESDISLSKIRNVPNQFWVYYYKSKMWYNESSSELITSPIPLGIEPLGSIYFNHSDYSLHKLEYKEYLEWDRKKNVERYNTNKRHGQKMDAKNVQHVVRILIMALELPNKLTLDIDMSHKRDYLLPIKHGKVNLKETMDEWLKKVENLKDVYESSDLPDSIDIKRIDEITHNIIYRISN